MNLKHDEENEQRDLWNVRGEGVDYGFLRVIEDESTLLDTVHDGAEVIVE